MHASRSFFSLCPGGDAAVERKNRPWWVVASKDDKFMFARQHAAEIRIINAKITRNMSGKVEYVAAH
jgi:hypothetical protein